MLDSARWRPTKFSGGLRARSLVWELSWEDLPASSRSRVSWEGIGWHEKTLVTLQNEDDVSAGIAYHMKKSGGPKRKA
jgi:hypothetical protein